jgi:hypothetical protein
MTAPSVPIPDPNSANLLALLIGAIISFLFIYTLATA